MEGCDLCGDFPVVLAGRCHPGAPLRIEMDEDNVMTLYCYVPECRRVVGRFKVEQVNPS